MTLPTSRRNPSAIKSAVNAVTDPGLTLRVRAIVERAIWPLARTCSKICCRSEYASRADGLKIGPYPIPGGIDSVFSLNPSPDINSPFELYIVKILNFFTKTVILGSK